MRRIFCKNGEAKPSKATKTLESNETTIVIKDVPAFICDNCGEKYFDDKTTERILEIAENAFKAEVEVCKYKAA